jgi:hypothetical protein
MELITANTHLILKQVAFVFFLIFIGAAFEANAQTTVVTVLHVVTPPPFPPTIPSLEPDDSWVSYNYEVTGSGWLDPDIDSVQVGLYTAVEEQTLHNKTNGLQVSSSRSDALSTYLTIPFCSLAFWQYQSNYVTCVDSNCGAVTDWSESPDGTGPEGGTGGPGSGGNDITFYTNYNLSCGTLTIGTSQFDYFHPANPLQGGPCGEIPTIAAAGAGRLYQISLFLTPDCNNNSISPDLPAINSFPAPNISLLGTSQNPLTPSGGSLSSGKFQFNFNTSGSTTNYFGVYASTNLEDWEYLGSLPATTNSQESFTDYYASNYTQRFYIVESNQLACSSAYGFVNLALPAGRSMIGNPLLGTNMTIGTLITNVPNSTTLQFWGTTNWGPTATYSSGSWDNPNWTLIPGDGAFIDVSTNINIKFIGQVLDGNITNMIPTGFSVRSPAYPLATDINCLGLTGLTNGDYILEWNGTGYTGYTNVSGTWEPSTPTVAVGQSFIVYSSVGTSWGVEFTAADVYALSQPIIDYITATNDVANDGGMGYTIALNWDVTGWGTLERDAVAPPGAMYELREYDDPDSQEFDWQGLYNDVFTPVTSASLHGTITMPQPVNFPIITPSPDHDYFVFRYTNGRIHGPWSAPANNPY